MYKLSTNNAIEDHLCLISIRDAKEKSRRLFNKTIKEKQKQIKHEVSTESKGINFCCDTNEIKQSTLTRNCGLKEYCSLIICLHSYISLCVKLEVLNVLLNCEKKCILPKKTYLNDMFFHCLVQFLWRFSRTARKCFASVQIVFCPGSNLKELHHVVIFRRSSRMRQPGLFWYH